MASIDINFLLGKELLQICFGLYQVILNFSENASISVEHRLVYANKSGECFTWNCGQRNNLPIQSSLGYKVVEANLTPEQSINLVFENQDELTIQVSENKKFESYQINYGAKYFVV
jgi:hypothetical protein